MIVKVDNYLLESSGLKVENLLTIVKQAFGTLVTHERLVFIETKIVNSSTPPIATNEFYLILSYAPITGLSEDLRVGLISFHVAPQQGNKGFIFREWINSSNFNYLVHHFRIV